MKVVPAWWRAMAIVYAVGFFVMFFFLAGVTRRQITLGTSHAKLRDRVETLESRLSRRERE